MAIEVIYVDIGGDGYYPVLHMARLAAELLETELVVLRRNSLGSVAKLAALLPRGRGHLAGLLICPWPRDLDALLLVNGWRKRYERLVAWVFDSFWPESIPRSMRWRGIFDHVFITEREDLTTWRAMLRVPVDWLPWGSDTLRLGSASPVRPVDLMRLGRQPPDWDDDASTTAACASVQLRFHGRPAYLQDPGESHRELVKTLAQAKFTLSFSNLANPGPHTHAVRDYITARWTDALSAGAIVAGIPPRGDSAQALLWEDALLDLGTMDRARGLEVLADAVSHWTPQRALRNHLRSLEVLDWRWRFEKLAAALDIRPQKLCTELTLLRRAIADNRSQASRPSPGEP